MAGTWATETGSRSRRAAAALRRPGPARLNGFSNRPPSIGALPGAGGRAAWLVDTYAYEASTDNDKAAGLQIAVWTTMYAAGSFSISAPLTAMNWAGTYLGTLGTNTATGIYFDAAPGAGQDQIATPEPASILLLAIGMTMALGFGYRMKRQTVIA